MDPEAIIGIAAGVVAGVAGIGVGVFWYSCPRAFAIYFGRKVPKLKKARPKAVPKPDILEISQNPLVVHPRKPHAHALPWEVDIDAVNKIRRLKQEFKAAPVRK